MFVLGEKNAMSQKLFFKVTGMGLSNCLSEAFQLIIENYKQDTRLTNICYVKKSSVCHVISILVQYITVKNLFQADFSICSLNMNKKNLGVCHIQIQAWILNFLYNV